MKSVYLLGCLLLVSTISPSRPQKENSMTAATTDRTFFRLGDNLITISKLSHPRERSFVLVSLHNDEETSLYKSSRFLTLEFQNINNKNVLTSYSVKGGQKMIMGDSVIFSVKGKILID